MRKFKKVVILFSKRPKFQHLLYNIDEFITTKFVTEFMIDCYIRVKRFNDKIDQISYINIIQ